jgi:hypothetical protein
MLLKLGQSSTSGSYRTVLGRRHYGRKHRTVVNHNRVSRGITLNRGSGTGVYEQISNAWPWLVVSGVLVGCGSSNSTMTGPTPDFSLLLSTQAVFFPIGVGSGKVQLPSGIQRILTAGDRVSHGAATLSFRRQLALGPSTEYRCTYARSWRSDPAACGSAVENGNCRSVGPRDLLASGARRVARVCLAPTRTMGVGWPVKDTTPREPISLLALLLPLRRDR